MRQLLITSFLLFSLYSVSQSKYVQAEELYEKAMTSYKQRSLPEAEQFIEQSLFLNPMAESYYLSGLIYEALGEEMKALSAYEATIKFDPAYQEAIFQKALIYLKVGDTEKALSDFNLLLENHDNIETHGVYFQVDPTGNSQNKVLSLVNLKGQLYHYRGQAYQQLEKYDEALRDYTNALKTDTAADYYISRALLRAELGDDSLATLDLNAALAIEPKNQLAWYNLALLNPAIDPPDSLLKESAFSPILNLLGTRALENGDLRIARRYFDLYLLNNATDALGYVNRGRLLLKTSDYMKARNDFQRAREIDPSRSEVLYLIGNSYFFQGEFRSALAYYNQYLAVDPTNSVVWYNGAMSYLELKEHTEACHFLHNAEKFGMQAAKEIMDRHCSKE